MGLWDFAKGYRPLVEGSHSSTPWSTPSVALQTAREAYSHTIPRFRMRWVAALIVSTAAIVLSLTYLRANTEVAASASSIPSASSVPSAVLVDGTTFQKPEGFKIIGLLFFGRRATMSILECYLRNNLVAYGGFLDEIHFITNTGDEDDLAWLAQMVDEVDDYIRVDLEQAGYVRDFNRIYAESLKRDNMYVKLDDDLVCRLPPIHHHGSR